MPKKKLSNQHSHFCTLMVSGTINQTHAYMECYPDSTYDTARNGAAQLIAKPCIKEEVARLKGLTEAGDVTSRKFKREELKKDVKQNDIKYQDKHRAIDLDNRMSGDNEPDVIEHNITIKWGDAEK